jgi:hypothetical protein
MEEETEEERARREAIRWLREAFRRAFDDAMRATAAEDREPWESDPGEWKDDG